MRVIVWQGRLVAIWCVALFNWSWAFFAPSRGGRALAIGMSTHEDRERGLWGGIGRSIAYADKGQMKNHLIVGDIGGLLALSFSACLLQLTRLVSCRGLYKSARVEHELRSFGPREKVAKILV